MLHKLSFCKGQHTRRIWKSNASDCFSVTLTFNMTNFNWCISHSFQVSINLQSNKNIIELSCVHYHVVQLNQRVVFMLLHYCLQKLLYKKWNKRLCINNQFEKNISSRLWPLATGNVYTVNEKTAVQVRIEIVSWKSFSWQNMLANFGLFAIFSCRMHNEAYNWSKRENWW